MSVKYFKNNFNIIMLYRNLYAFKFDINEIKEKIFLETIILQTFSYLGYF